MGYRSQSVFVWSKDGEIRSLKAGAFADMIMREWNVYDGNVRQIEVN